MAFSRVRRRLLMVALAHIDIDENKQLEFEEWCEALGRLGVLERNAADVFALLDVDHDMNLSVNEVEQIVGSKIHLSEEDLEKVFTEMLSGKFDTSSDARSTFTGESTERYNKMYDKWLGEGTRKGTEKLKRHFLCDSQLTCFDKIEKLIADNVFNSFIGFLIVCNAVTIGIEADMTQDSGNKASILKGFEHAFTAIFLFEALLKMSVMRWQFFKSRFNLFDLVLVVVSIFDNWIFGVISDQGSMLSSIQILRILRMLRLVKVFRVLKIFRELRLLVLGLVAGFRTLAWTMVLLTILIYVCAIFATVMLAPSPTELTREETACLQYVSPKEFLDENFGTIGKSMFTLAQIMTLDSWAVHVVRPTEKIVPYMWLFFLSFLCLSTFVILNLVTGIFLDQTLSVAKQDHNAEMERIRRKRETQFTKLKEMFEAVDEDGSGELNENEFEMLVEDSTVLALFQSIGFEASELSKLFHVLDANGQGFVDLYEFINGMMKLQREVKMADLIQISMQNNACSKTLDALGQKLEAMEDTFQRALGMSKATDANDGASDVPSGSHRNSKLMNGLHPLEVGTAAGTPITTPGGSPTNAGVSASATPTHGSAHVMSSNPVPPALERRIEEIISKRLDKLKSERLGVMMGNLQKLESMVQLLSRSNAMAKDNGSGSSSNFLEVNGCGWQS
eukprot:gnl/MRDRNA2_/MRDRNA2_249301_c0_seq1.p1 gnl/MRDRNA2_/MRDRNA2_249301_c0~~gnl/MRDRNA2_/MRDRNA2_249301_c0_seq1.p1  ORF type:complete len:779 (+),score=152.16 gnl/MRDRNA2_/MRDRNA2_249301_c0_seq1:307-2337(+)